MTNAEFYEMQKVRKTEMDDAIIKSQCELDDKGVLYSASGVNYDFRPYWVNVETSDFGRVIYHWFGCVDKKQARETARYLLQHGFYSATIFSAHGPIPTFYAPELEKYFDCEFDYYIG